MKGREPAQTTTNMTHTPTNKHMRSTHHKKKKKKAAFTQRGDQRHVKVTRCTPPSEQLATGWTGGHGLSCGRRRSPISVCRQCAKKINKKLIIFTCSGWRWRKQTHPRPSQKVAPQYVEHIHARKRPTYRNLPPHYLVHDPDCSNGTKLMHTPDKRPLTSPFS